MINSERALILAPRGRDGAVAAQVLATAGKDATITPSLADLLAGLRQGAGVALLAIEALQHASLERLREWIGSQEPWSDFPFVILGLRTHQPEQLLLLQRVQATLGNVIVLERPFHPTALVDIVENALRGRRRQYQARANLHDLSENAARLRFLDALGKATANCNDADAILAVTTRMVGEHLSVSNCAYADMEPDEDHFTIRGDWAVAGSRSIVGYYSLADFGRLAVANLTAGLPLVVNDNLRELAPHEAATFQAIGIAATICMPLVRAGRLTALMAIHDREPRVWSAGDLALLTEVTERSWAHIARVRSEAAARAAEQRFLAELERQVAERTAALAQSEKNVRVILETSHLHQGLLSTDGSIAYVNANSLAAIQSSSDDVLGRPFWATAWFAGTPGAAAAVRDAVRAAAAGEGFRADMTLDLPTGARRFDFSLRPVTNDRGIVVALVWEAIETTERARIAEALQQAQKMEALGNLTGGVAHDFNNLLMVVQGSLELLRKRLPPDPGLLRFVDNALEGARRGKSLTERMLAFARRQALKSEPIDAGELVRGMTELLERSLGPMVAVEVAFPPGLPAVFTDANQLESALLNLAVNARDAMDGVGRITISGSDEIVAEGHETLAPGRYLRLTVADTGEGMDEATLKRATEPFFTTKGVGKGTGLGLSMVHGLAEQSGGTLLLKSESGQGTVAEIWLPAHISRAAADAAPEHRDAPAPGEAPRRLSILAVDDDALVLMNTVAMLEDLGHHVSAAHSGEEALSLIESVPVDLVVTDHAMPKMTGAQLVSELRATRPKLPIILATGYAELPPTLAGNGVPRLAKPFAQGDLATMIARVVSPQGDTAGV